MTEYSILAGRLGPYYSLETMLKELDEEAPQPRKEPRMIPLLWLLNLLASLVPS